MTVVDLAMFRSQAGMVLSEIYLRWSVTKIPDSKVHGTSMGPTSGQQDPGGPHVAYMNLSIHYSYIISDMHATLRITR